MDADGVRLHLIEHVEEANIFQEKMLDALRIAHDPPKLALDVFRNHHLRFPFES